jgi:hypothetical protein
MLAVLACWLWILAVGWSCATSVLLVVHSSELPTTCVARILTVLLMRWQASRVPSVAGKWRCAHVLFGRQCLYDRSVM